MCYSTQFLILVLVFHGKLCSLIAVANLLPVKRTTVVALYRQCSEYVCPSSWGVSFCGLLEYIDVVDSAPAFIIIHRYPHSRGTRGGIVVKALRYKLAGRGFDSRWCHWNFSLTILPVALWPWGRLSL